MVKPWWNSHFYLPVNIYLFKVYNRNARKRCEICSKLTMKAPEWCRHRSGVFIVNFEHISRLFLEILLLTLNKQMLAGIKGIKISKEIWHMVIWPKNVFLSTFHRGISPRKEFWEVNTWRTLVWNDLNERL